MPVARAEGQRLDARVGAGRLANLRSSEFSKKSLRVDPSYSGRASQTRFPTHVADSFAHSACGSAGAPPGSLAQEDNEGLWRGSLELLVAVARVEPIQGCFSGAPGSEP